MFLSYWIRINKWAQAPELEHCARLPVPLNSRGGPSRKVGAEAIHPCQQEFPPSLHCFAQRLIHTHKHRQESGRRRDKASEVPEQQRSLILSQKLPHLHTPHLMRQRLSPHTFEPLKCSRTMQLCFFENRLGQGDKVHFHSKMTFWCKDSEIWRVRHREREPFPHRQV